MIENSSEAGRGLSSRFILPRRERPLLAGNDRLGKGFEIPVYKKSQIFE